jgi:hypothetical protein
VNFTFNPSPEKAKEFTAVEDAFEPKITPRLRDVEKWGQAPFSPFCVSYQNPDLVYYNTSKCT